MIREKLEVQLLVSAIILYLNKYGIYLLFLDVAYLTLRCNNETKRDREMSEETEAV
jgi:hypothetical protein